MGIFGFLGGGSEAKAKAKLYAKVEKELGEKITSINMNLDTVEDALQIVDNTFVNGGGEAEGKIMTDFIHKESLWNIRYREILMEMKAGVTTLQMRKTEATQRKEYWEMEAQKEEMKANG